MKTNPLAVLDPHRYVTITEMVLLAACIAAYMYAFVLLHLCVKALLGKLIRRAEEAVDRGVWVVFAQLSGAFRQLVNKLKELGFLDVDFLMDVARSLLLDNRLTFVISSAVVILLLALGLTALSQFVLLRRRLWEPFARRRALPAYLVLCVLLSVAAAVAFVCLAYALYAVAHGLIKACFRFRPAVLGFSDFVEIGLPGLLIGSNAWVLLAVYVTVSVLGGAMFYVFYTDSDAFGRLGQDGLTGDRLRDTLRFSRSVSGLCALVALPIAVHPGRG